MEKRKVEEFAVILNQNARRVTRGLIRSAQEIAPRIALYTSRTREEAYQILQELMDRGVRRIISGGGDGTFCQLLSQARQYLEEQNARLQSMGRQAREEIARFSLPQFGILKLGTGNSLAPLLGIKGGLEPVRRLAEGEEFPTRRIHLLEAERQCFTFCGLGWDARILNDYLWLKNCCRRRLLSRLVQSLPGYLAAIFVRTIPAVLLARRRIETRIVNLGRRLFRILPGGTLEKVACPPGEIIYQGHCNITGAATTPYYGFGLTAFPYAMREPGLMQLRIVRAGVGELLAHAWPIWRGTYQSPGFLDYLAEDVDFRFSEEMPFQLGGDAAGTRKEIRVRVSQLTVDLLDFRTPLSRAGPAAAASGFGSSPPL